MRNDEAAIIALCRSKSQNLTGIPLDRDGIVRGFFLPILITVSNHFFILRLSMMKERLCKKREPQ